MRHFIKIVLPVCFIICLAAWGGIRLLNHQFVHKLPEWISDLSGPFAVVQAESVRHADCSFQICADIQNLTIHPAGYTPVTIPHTFVAIPVKWPIQVHIQTSDTDPINVNADFSDERWHIQQLSGQIDSFRFSVQGDIRTQENQGFLTLQTTGLNQFIRHYVDLPDWMKFIIRDTPQEFKLVPDSGYLRLYGLPLIPLK
ncbi:MAG: hypothetical protein IJV07_04975 [Alphaproteobacteria bacterium]|nr:hypothetical protein [Alphaproteobacteria bacterium]